MNTFVTTILFIFLFSFLKVQAQKEANEWFFGEHVWVSFASGQPVLKEKVPLVTSEGCASVCDADGNLKFYTDTRKVWNAQHQQMPNGFGLMGGVSATQGVIIIPHPADKNRYYIFSAADRTNFNTTSGFHYSIVNMSLEGGLGDLEKKNVQLLKDNVSEAVTATLNCDGKGFWVITHSEKGNIFYAFLVTADSISTNPIISDLYDPEEEYFQPFLKISPDTKQIALTSNLLPPNTSKAAALRLYKFDNVSGKVSEKISLMDASTEGCYGLTFSPDNSKLYVGQREISHERYLDSALAQFDVTLSTPAAIRASKVNLFRKLSPAAMQIAPDRKIYIPLGQSLAVIENPDLPGKACNYRPNAFSLLPNYASIGIPNFPDSYFQAGKRNLLCAVPKTVFTFDTVCAGNQVRYSEDSDNEPQGWRWTFEGGQPAEYSGQFPPPIYYENAGNFTTTLVTDNRWGNDTLKRSVLIRALPNADAGPDVVICRDNGSAQIGTKPEPGIEYKWTPVTGLDNSVAAQPIARPNTTTRYYLYAKNAFECEAIDSVLVTVGDITADVSPDTLICYGESIELTASGGSRYHWSPSIGLSSTEGASVIASPLVTTRYSVTVSGGEGAGCNETKEVLVKVWKAPEDIAGDGKTICQGNSVELGFKNNSPEYLYEWIPVTGLSDISIANPIASPETTTKYFVKVKNPDGQCFAEDSILIIVMPAPDLSTNDTAFCEGQTGVLRAQSSDPDVTYTWLPTTGLSNPNIPNPVATALETTSYQVTARNANGCETTKTVILTVSFKELIIAKITSENEEVEPGGSTKVAVAITSQSSNDGILSFKASILYDPAAFLFKEDSDVFLYGANDSWSISSKELAPGLLSIDALGTKFLKEINIQFELNAYLAAQKEDSISMTFTEINGMATGMPGNCQKIVTQSDRLLLSKVCGGDLRYIDVGKFFTSLQDISPNPVSSADARIIYSNGLDGPIYLAVYSSEGKKIKTLYEGFKNAGIHEISFKTDDLATGMYIVRLTTLYEIQNKTMILKK
jgi:hypothetical protein